MIRRTKLTFDAQRWKAEEALKREGTAILVCAGTGCIANGAMKVYEKFQEVCQAKGLNVLVRLQEEPHDGGSRDIHLKKTGCHGFCEIGPLVNITPQDIFYTHVRPEDCEEIVEKTILGGEVVRRLLYRSGKQAFVTQEDVPFYKKQHRLVLENCGHTDAENIWEYVARGGYTAFEKAPV